MKTAEIKKIKAEKIKAVKDGKIITKTDISK
jgi:hypothetical protein